MAVAVAYCCVNHSSVHCDRIYVNDVKKITMYFSQKLACALSVPHIFEVLRQQLSFWRPALSCWDLDSAVWLSSQVWVRQELDCVSPVKKCIICSIIICIRVNTGEKASLQVWDKGLSIVILSLQCSTFVHQCTQLLCAVDISNI